jgi:hypothetical protein
MRMTRRNNEQRGVLQYSVSEYLRIFGLGVNVFGIRALTNVRIEVQCHAKCNNSRLSSKALRKHVAATIRKRSAIMYLNYSRIIN